MIVDYQLCDLYIDYIAIEIFIFKCIIIDSTIYCQSFFSSQNLSVFSSKFQKSQFSVKFCQNFGFDFQIFLGFWLKVLKSYNFCQNLSNYGFLKSNLSVSSSKLLKKVHFYPKLSVFRSNFEKKVSIFCQNTQSLFFKVKICQFYVNIF